MSILELRQNKQGMGTWNAMEEKSRHEVLPGFHDLTMKEKYLYLMKISKRNTSHHTIVAAGLTILVFAVDYLFL